MNPQELYSRLGTELVKQLTQAESAEQLAQMAAEQQKALSAEEARALFDALAPLRGKQPIDDADLLQVSGGGADGKLPKPGLPSKPPIIL